MIGQFYVYAYIDPITKFPFYIGKGKNNRAKKHLSETKQNTENYKKWAYIQGLRNKKLEPEIVILYSDLLEKDAYEKESLLIVNYGRKDIDDGGILTNICLDNRPPNNTGKLYTDEVKANMSKAQKKWFSENKRKPRSEESKSKTSEKTKGANNPMFGKSAYDKMVEKYGKEEADLRWKDRYEKSTFKNKLKRRTPEQIEKMSFSQKGITNLGTKYIININTGRLKKIHKDKLSEFLLHNPEWKQGVKL